MKDIYIVTHPEATHHVDGVVGGWFDSDLTERGSIQAEAIAASLATRIRGTSVEVFSSGTSVTIDRDLREKSYGEAEGKDQSWLKERSIPLPEFGERLRHDEGIAGAETRMDLAIRAYRVMRRIQESPGEQQVLVTHGGTTTLLIAAWIGMPIDAAGVVQFKVSAGSISVLRKDDQNYSHQVAQLNDVSHFA
jgi:2,3-bisphosphoglycerate-dependent phosphoglycerate mutase